MIRDELRTQRGKRVERQAVAKHLAVLDRAFALELGAHIESQIAQSLPINTPDRLRTRAPWWLRPFVAVAARAFVALAGGVKNEY